MVSAGTIINPILKVVTTVAILAAVYVFIIKPARESTDDISANVAESSQQIQQDIQDSIRESMNGAGIQVNDAVKDAQQALGEAGIDNGTPGAEQGTAMLDCVQGANGNIEAIQACVASP